MQVVWNKCDYDDVYDNDTFYSLWRLDEDFSRNVILGTQKEILLTSGKQTFAKNIERQNNLASDKFQ